MTENNQKSLFFLIILTGLILTSGCFQTDNATTQPVQSTTRLSLVTSPILHDSDLNKTALDIALGNATVQQYLKNGYSVSSIEPTTVGINEMQISVTRVQFDTADDLVNVNVDIENSSIVNIWTLPKRVPPP